MVLVRARCNLMWVEWGAAECSPMKFSKTLPTPVNYFITPMEIAIIRHYPAEYPKKPLPLHKNFEKMKKKFGNNSYTLGKQRDRVC